MQLTTQDFRKIAFAIVGLLLAAMLPAQSFNDSFEQDLEDGANVTFAPADEEELRLRTLNLDGPIQGYWGEDVKKLINHRLKQREFTQQLIGKTVMYGSFIEKALIENNLPVELANLCIVESALNPRLVSRAGAAGLWQIMPETAKELGLKVTPAIDERFDPYKSTQAATKYLKQLYDKFQDWGLALAAYNAGEYRINTALKQIKEGVQDYWAIRKFLKPETQNYIPAYLAATYIMQYYPWHNLKPQLPHLDLQITEAMVIKENLNFSLLSQITEVPVATIQLLNPSYTKDYVPANESGNYLILPKRVVPTLVAYLNLPKELRPDMSHKPVLLTASVNPNTFYEKIKITIGANDNVHNLAQAFNCSALNIRTWNQLASYYVAQGQQVRIFVPKTTSIETTAASIATAPLTKNELKDEKVLQAKPILDKREKVDDVLALNAVVKAEVNPNDKPKENTIEKLKKISALSDIDTPNKYVYHYFGRNESLLDIAEKYGVSSVSSLLALNNLSVNDTPIIGSKLKVKVL
jgi:membrane-bound lytic murein transglycosylase D